MKDLEKVRTALFADINQLLGEIGIIGSGTHFAQKCFDLRTPPGNDPIDRCWYQQPTLALVLRFSF
jgi:hypothetical protein